MFFKIVARAHTHTNILFYSKCGVKITSTNKVKQFIKKKQKHGLERQRSRFDKHHGV
jgi:hypothetical protein